MNDSFHGLYRAVVLDNADPQRAQRLRISVPALDDVSASWASACVPAGLAGVPAIGDIVWVMFEAGNPERPVWLGVLPGSQD
jgi:hypothetical protein